MVSQWEVTDGEETTQLQLNRQDGTAEVHLTLRCMGLNVDSTVSITLSEDGRRELIAELQHGLGVAS
ncbi:MAG: hypothetical protein M3440_04915 [Chloroflexota bacterium]|nr:hypothetical protein [Chloroflexota bacterium]